MVNTISQKRDVAGFDAINLKGFGDIYLTQGESESLTLEGDKEQLSHITTEVANGELKISLENWFDFLSLTRPLKIYVALKEVHSVSVSGSGTLHAANVKTDHLKLRVSGSSKMEISSLAANDLDINLSSSAEFDLSGKVDHQDLRISGVGKYRGGDLESKTATVNISGSCHLTLNVQELLDVSGSGSAEVRYAGSPKIKQHLTGSASIKPVD